MPAQLHAAGIHHNGTQVSRHTDALCASVSMLAAVQLADAACPALTVDFFPSDTENVPEGWTKSSTGSGRKRG